MATALKEQSGTGLTLVSVNEAIRSIHENMMPLASCMHSIDDVADEILREDVATDRDLPPYDRVTMDGYALRADALPDDRIEFTVQETLPAGQPPATLGNNADCIEVMTGSTLPTGCDCVVPVERVDILGSKIRLESGYKPQPDQHIHRQGSDFVNGTVLLRAGTRLRSPDIAVLASVGKATVSVSERPDVSVITTGDELTDITDEVLPHQIRRSNDRAIQAALRNDGHSCSTRSHVADDPLQLRQVIEVALRDSGILILSGGVSMGKFDYLPEVLEQAGVRLVFHKVSQRPGKPMWFGVGPEGQSVFALPGNPVSTLVCMRRFVLPAISKAMGAKDNRPMVVKLAERVTFKPALTWFLPVCLQAETNGSVWAEPRPTNTSGDFASLSASDGFVELDRDLEVFEKGYTAQFFGW